VGFNPSPTPRKGREIRTRSRNRGVITRFRWGKWEGGLRVPSTYPRGGVLGTLAFYRISSVRGVSIPARVPPPETGPPSLGAVMGSKLMGGTRESRTPRTDAS